VSEVTISWNPSGFLAAIEKSVDDGLDAASNVLAGQARRNIVSGNKGTPSQPGQHPNSQTNNLRNGIGRTKARGGTCLVGSGKNAPYGLWLEFGFNNSAKPLAIPLSDWARSQTAKPRDTIGRLQAQHGYAIRPSKSGLLIGTQTGSGKAAKFTAHFLITRKRIAARPWLRPALATSRKTMFAVFVKASSQSMRAQAKSVGEA